MNQRFGGEWTEKKLNILKDYLVSYLTALKKQHFHKLYIDAFAGSGSITLDSSDISSQQFLFDDFLMVPQDFLQGSARVALSLQNSFDEYIFIEKNPVHANALERLKQEFPERKESVHILTGEANSLLQEICKRTDWISHRATLFLDPYGMQVDWETIKLVASTKAIDALILFPSGVAVNRLLSKSGQIPAGFEKSLDRIFGSHDWKNLFYKEDNQTGLFEVESKQRKSGSIAAIANYYNSRLREIFAGVEEEPFPLRRDDGHVLYHLCFVAANEKGAKIAERIAKQIFKKYGNPIPH